MAEAIVTEILDDNAKSGIGKNGKPWSMSRVGLSNGESIFIFNPIELGQVVESHQDGAYTNWKPKKEDPKHEEIMNALRKIYTAITGEVEVKPEPEPRKPVNEGIDKVYPVDETEPVDLKDIPF